MKYLTKEWYNQKAGSDTYLLMYVSKPAETFSEEYFQDLYKRKLDEFLKLHKDMSELTADDVFPSNAWENFSMVNQDGEFVDAAEYLSKEELERIREGIRREEQEAYNNFVPEVYDEEVLTKQFHVNILNERVKQLKAILPEDIQKDIADIRVLAFDEASEDIYKRILEFCLHKEERALKIEQDCQNYYDSIAEQLPENIRKKYGFHDCRVINFEQNGTDAILELDQRGGYSNVCKVIFHNAEVLEQEDIAGSWWLYQEIYLRDGLYEFHAMLHDENGVLRYLTLTAADVEFVKDGE